MNHRIASHRIARKYTSRCYRNKNRRRHSAGLFLVIVPEARTGAREVQYRVLQAQCSTCGVRSFRSLTTRLSRLQNTHSFVRPSNPHKLVFRTVPSFRYSFLAPRVHTPLLSIFVFPLLPLPFFSFNQHRTACTVLHPSHGQSGTDLILILPLLSSPAYPT